ncbi:MAG: hypothetical protein V1834_03070 [Candidatus Micrarchaeota archaeon]
MVLQPIVILLLSLVVLSKSSHYILDSSIKLAKFFRVSAMAIGFILISIATSLPELMVSLLAAIQGTPGLSIGNVLGANIADVTLVLGLAALAASTSKEHALLVKTRGELVSLIKILLVASVLPLLLLVESISSYAGLFLLGVFAAYSFFIFKEGVSASQKDSVTARDAVYAGMTFGASAVVLLLSAHFVVSSAVSLSEAFGLAPAVIGATIIALGTTLPEAVVSVAAARRGEHGIAFGTVLGSCVVNLSLILGLSSLITTAVVNLSVFADLVVFALFSNLVLWVLLLYRKKLGFPEGVALLGVYVLFLLSTLLLVLGR